MGLQQGADAPLWGSVLIWCRPMGSQPRTFLAGRSAPSLPGPAGIFLGVSADRAQTTPLRSIHGPLTTAFLPLSSTQLMDGLCEAARLRAPDCDNEQL